MKKVTLLAAAAAIALPATINAKSDFDGVTVSLGAGVDYSSAAISDLNKAATSSAFATATNNNSWMRFNGTLKLEYGMVIPGSKFFFGAGVDGTAGYNYQTADAGYKSDDKAMADSQYRVEVSPAAYSAALRLIPGFLASPKVMIGLPIGVEWQPYKVIMSSKVADATDAKKLGTPLSETVDATFAQSLRLKVGPELRYSMGAWGILGGAAFTYAFNGYTLASADLNGGTAATADAQAKKPLNALVAQKAPLNAALNMGVQGYLGVYFTF